MASHLGTRHHEVFCTHAQIAEVFPEVIWHTESPILRTAPAPLYLLSDLVHQQGYKVVLTGEGADEVLAGYDIFKEMRVRRFWARRPESELRPLLLRRLYPDIPAMSRAEAFRQDFFRQGLLDTESPTYSHAVRWSNTARLGRFLTTRGSIPSNGGPPTPVPLTVTRFPVKGSTRMIWVGQETPEQVPSLTRRLAKKICSDWRWR
jgi:asparagine synthase (glutamine-hydrolysing)